MMDCRKARQLIPHAADDHLGDRERSRLDDHLASCDACRKLLNSHRATIRSIEDALSLAAGEVTLPSDFASLVASRAAEELSGGETRFPAFVDRLAGIWVALSGSRRAVAAAAAATTIAATALTGAVLGRALDSSPVTVTQVYSGHRMTFTARPRSDGSVVAGINAHRYCLIIRARQEALP